MRQISLFLLCLLWMCGSQAFPKDKKPIIYMAPGFHFSEVSTDPICVAPAIDLRQNKAVALNFSGPDNYQRTGWNAPLSGSVDGDLARAFKAGVSAHDVPILKVLHEIPIVKCNPVSATLDNITAPTKEWIDQMDFGRSRWLFVLAVVDVDMSEFMDPKHKFMGMKVGKTYGHAIVTEALFDKQSERLVWSATVDGPARVGRNWRIVGVPKSVHGAEAKRELESPLAGLAVKNGIDFGLDFFCDCSRRQKHTSYLGPHI